jgi:hypothetical protein
MARKAGQIVACEASTWLVRIYLGRDQQSGTRKILEPAHSWSFSRSAQILPIETSWASNSGDRCYLRIYDAACACPLKHFALMDSLGITALNRLSSGEKTCLQWSG